MVQEIKATLVEARNKQVNECQRLISDKQKELDNALLEVTQLKAQMDKRVEETKRKQWVSDAKTVGQ